MKQKIVKIPPSCPPDETLLNYLREELGRTGTKEGCASGDCGACTCLVRQPGDLSYESINACITPLGDVINAEVLCVEDLAEGEGVHPVQSAFVALHSSQCGFCTPGFVMSLAGRLDPRHPLGQVESSQSRQTWVDAISGNLCRCTGYRPILDAADEAAKAPAIARTLSSGMVINAASSQDDPDGAVMPSYFRPRALSTLSKLLRANPDAVLMAGGTDRMLGVTQRGESLPIIISTRDVEEMNVLKVDAAKGEICLGASLTFSDLEYSLAEVWPALSDFLKRIGSPQIRNRGTLGGNLGTASPIGDCLPILLAMDASLMTQTASGTQRVLPMSSFITGYRQTSLEPGEVIVSIEMQGLSDVQYFRKVTKRYEDDISAVSAAFRWRFVGGRFGLARVAYGGVADRPVRLSSVEQRLADQALNRELIEEVVDLAMRAVSPLSDVRASAEYRRQMVGALLRQSLEQCLEREGAIIG